MPLVELIQFSSNIITVKIYESIRTNIQARGSRESLMVLSYTQRGEQFKHTLDVHIWSTVYVFFVSQHDRD